MSDDIDSRVTQVERDVQQLVTLETARLRDVVATARATQHQPGKHRRPSRWRFLGR